MSMHRRVPIVTPVKGRRQFLWRCDIGVAVQNMTDLVRIFLVDTRQGQLCEPLGSRRIKSFAGRFCTRAFLRSTAAAIRTTNYHHCQQAADENRKTSKMKSERHGRENHASAALGEAVVL